MARKARMEYAGAYDHILNRGNCRSWLFESEGVRKSFLIGLRECCEAKGWRLHAWVLIPGKSPSDLERTRKCEDGKVAVGRRLREKYPVRHAWIAENVHMGAASTLQSQSTPRKVRRL